MGYTWQSESGPAEPTCDLHAFSVAGSDAQLLVLPCKVIDDLDRQVSHPKRMLKSAGRTPLDAVLCITDFADVEPVWLSMTVAFVCVSPIPIYFHAHRLLLPFKNGCGLELGGCTCCGRPLGRRNNLVPAALGL